MFFVFLSARRVLKVAMTRSIWLLSLWWLPTAPFGIRLSRSLQSSWTRCSPAFLLFVRSRKPLTCRRACISRIRNKNRLFLFTKPLIAHYEHFFIFTPRWCFWGVMYMFPFILTVHTQTTNMENDLSLLGEHSVLFLAKGWSVCLF